MGSIYHAQIEIDDYRDYYTPKQLDDIIRILLRITFATVTKVVVIKVKGDKQ